MTTLKKTLISLIAATIILGGEAKASIFKKSLLDYTIKWIKKSREDETDKTPHIIHKKDYSKESYNTAIQEISTPKQVRDYCDKINYKSDQSVYGNKDFWASFKLTHQNKAGDCEDFAIASAALLYDEGYSPTILFIKKGRSGHVVYVYEKAGKYGSIGESSSWREPKFHSINDLVESLGYTEFELIYLNKLGDFIDGSSNLAENSTRSFCKISEEEFRPILQTPESPRFSKNLQESSPAPSSPKTPVSIQNSITVQISQETLRQQKLDYFNSEKQKIIVLINSGKIMEADNLVAKLKQEIQEARSQGFY